jgi:hypothetical protein
VEHLAADGRERRQPGTDMDNGSFLGVITRERLLHDIRLRAEFDV